MEPPTSLFQDDNGELMFSEQMVAESTVFRLLAETCHEAEQAVQQLTTEELMQQVTQSISVLRKSLSNFQEGIRAITDDPAKIQAISEDLREAAVANGTGSSMANLQAPIAASTTTSMESSSLAVVTRQDELASTNAQDVRRALQFAEGMCQLMDNALGSISRDEIELASQLSLSVAKNLLQTGEAMFLSLLDEEQAKRITIEELEDDENADDDDEKEEEVFEATGDPSRQEQAQERATRKSKNKKRRDQHHRQQQQQQQLQRHRFQQLVQQSADQVIKQMKKNPLMSGLVAVASLPFVGLLVPLASVVGMCIVFEKYFPEKMSFAMDLIRSWMQILRLWMLLARISLRHFGLFACDCASQWYQYVRTHGVLETSKTVTCTAWEVSNVIVGRLASYLLQ